MLTLNSLASQLGSSPSSAAAAGGHQATRDAAHAMAATSAAAAPNAEAAAQAYATTLRFYGFCSMVRRAGDCAVSAFASATKKLADAPAGTRPTVAMVDTMATLWVVNDASYLHSVQSHSPGFTISTADGDKPVEAIGTAIVGIRTATGEWRFFEVPNVLLVSNCPHVLYSTRVMRGNHGFEHHIDSLRIDVPEDRRTGHSSSSIVVSDDGSGYAIPVAFVPAGSPKPERLTRFQRRLGQGLVATMTALAQTVCDALGEAYAAACTVSSPSVLSDLAASCEAGASFALSSASGLSQATLFQRLGFPYEEQWRHITRASTGHGQPDGATLSTTIPISNSVLRGRGRAAPFSSAQRDPETLPAPGAQYNGDFAGPMLPSHPHRFTCYSGWVDVGSKWVRAFPSHAMTAMVASATFALFRAELASLMGLASTYKPQMVRSDNGSAYISQHFREFVADRQIHQTFSSPYAPQQNSHVERAWGMIFGLARVLLAAARLPPTFHPFAVQTAVWILNRLPRPSLGNVSPYYLLTRRHPDISMLFCFGCLCVAHVPRAREVGDHHFSDRGEVGLYMGPSETSPGHVVYFPANRSVRVCARVRCYEDRFPGTPGTQYTWFPSEEDDPPVGQMPTTAPVTPPPDLALPPPPSSGAPAPLPALPAPAQGGSPMISNSSTAAPPSGAPSSAASFTPRSRPSTAPSSLPPASHPGPSVPFPSFEGPALPRPGSNDPSSRYFARQHPQRHRVPVDRFAASAFAPPQVDLGEEAIRQDSSWRAALLSACCVIPAACITSAVGAYVAATAHSPFHMALGCSAIAYVCSTAAMDAAFSAHCRPGSDWSISQVCTYASIIPALAVTVTSDFGDVPIPRGYSQAISCSNSAYWKEAIAKELTGLLNLNTWQIVLQSSMPPGSNLMHSHYVFTVKRTKTGSIDKFKARLVANGNTQKHGVDFDRVFATVVKTSTLRLVLILAALRDYDLHQVDIRQAYLQATLTEDLYMRLPPGVHQWDDQGRSLVAKLNRSLYDLKQAGREWAALFSSFLVSFGFARSTIDTCLYTFSSKSLHLWVCVYVDDALIVSNNSALRERFMSSLCERFPTDDRGELEWLLGVGISRDRSHRSLTLSQELYISDLVAKFASFASSGLSRRYDSPMQEGLQLSPSDCPAPDTPEHEAMADRRVAYMSIVGGLNWLANMTRHDIGYATSQLSRFLSNPGPAHFDAALRVLSYLHHTKSKPLTFSPNKLGRFEAFVDSSWLADFSCSGAYLMFAGCPFHWFSKMQRSVSLSSAEAEYFGAMLVAKEVMFFREILVELDVAIDGPTTTLIDSKSAVDMSFDPVAFKNTKHILRAAQFLRDLVSKGVIVLKHMAGKEMFADLLTKAISRQLFDVLRAVMDNYMSSGVAGLPERE